MENGRKITDVVHNIQETYKNTIQLRKLILRLKLISYHLSLQKVKAVVRCREQYKGPEAHQNRINTVEVFITVLVSAGIELIFFLVAGTVLCFGFSMRRMLITH